MTKKPTKPPVLQVRFSKDQQFLAEKLDRDSRALGFKSKSDYIRMLIARGMK